MTTKPPRKHLTYHPLQKIDTVNHYEKFGITLAIEAMSVPRSTIYRWVKLKKLGIENWQEGHSKRPKHLARQKITGELVEQIISLKKANPQLLYKQIARQLPIKISVSTICRVLKKYMQECKNSQP